MEGGENAPLSERWLTQYPQVSSRLNFDDDGLRAELVLSALEEGAGNSQSSFKVIEEGTKLLGEAKDFLSFEVGSKKIFSIKTKSSFAEDEAVAKSSQSSYTVLEAEESETGVALKIAMQQKDSNEEGPLHIRSSHLDGDYSFLGTESEEYSFIRREPVVQLPAKLKEGMIFEVMDRGVSVSEARPSIPIILTAQFHIVGLEDVSVPLGSFEDCLRLDIKGQRMSGEGVADISSSVWYARGHGVVKRVETSDRGGYVYSSEQELMTEEAPPENDEKQETTTPAE